MGTGIETTRAGRRAWIGLGVIALPCLLYSMDLTVLNLALPRISEELRPSSAQLLWIIDIYGFLVAGLLITMGSLGDRIGRRRLLLLGAAAFGIASTLAAFATSTATLIVARAALGIAGATLAPSTLSLIRNMFLDPRQRTLAIGVWIASYSVGSAVGPLLGGIMLQHFRWGAVFLLSVPVMGLLLAVGPWLLPEYRDPAPRRMDVPSALMSLVAVLLVIAGVKVYAQDGLGWWPLLSVGAGVAIAVVFAQRQRKLADPLIDLRLFRIPAFSASLTAYLIGTLAAFGSYIFIGQYLQLVLGLTPLQSGLWTLPWSGGFIVGSTLAPAIGRRGRPALVMSTGLFVAALGLAIMSRIPDSGLSALVAGSTIFSLGLAPVITLGTDLMVGAAPPERAGAAAAISETSSELGGALGIAVLGSIGTAIYRRDMAASPLVGVPPEGRLAARDTLGGATDVASHLSHQTGASLLQAAHDAFTHAMRTSIVLCAIVLALTAVMTIVTLRRIRAGGEAPTPEPAKAARRRLAEDSVA